MRQDKVLLLGIIGSLTIEVNDVIRSCQTSTDTWNRLAKLYANPSSSRTMGLTEQLTLMNRGTQPVKDYLATIRDIADEFALVGELVPNRFLITHTLNRLGADFKEIFVAVRAQDHLDFKELVQDKLEDYESFHKREELRSSGNLDNITANATRFTSSKHGNQPKVGKKKFQNTKGTHSQPTLLKITIGITLPTLD